MVKLNNVDLKMRESQQRTNAAVSSPRMLIQRLEFDWCAVRNTHNNAAAAAEEAEAAEAAAAAAAAATEAEQRTANCEPAMAARSCRYLPLIIEFHLLILHHSLLDKGVSAWKAASLLRSKAAAAATLAHRDPNKLALARSFRGRLVSLTLLL